MKIWTKGAVAVSSLALVAVGFNAGPASAAACSGTPATVNCTTSVTLAVAAGQLTITGASTIALTGVSITGDAQSTSGTAGTATQVRDNRGGGTAAAWTASAVATNFDNAGNTIPATGLDYNANNSASNTGPGSCTFNTVSDISTVDPVVTHTSVVGNNRCTWTPILTLAIPADGLVAGTYTSTMTTSVA